MSGDVQSSCSGGVRRSCTSGGTLRSCRSSCGCGSSINGNGGRSWSSIVITSPKGDRLDYVLQIHFAASNNVAEYEALIHGLKLAKEIGVHRILCFGDSDLVIQQASGEWDARDANMAP